MDQAQEPKISIVEIVFITPFYLLADAIGIALIMFGLDDFFILDILSSTSQFYLRFKGVNATPDLVMKLFEFLPYVGALPLYSAGWLITIGIDHNWGGKAGAALKEVGKLTKAAKPISK